MRHVGGTWGPGHCHDVDHWPASCAYASVPPSSALPAQQPSEPQLKPHKVMLGAAGRVKQVVGRGWARDLEPCVSSPLSSLCTAQLVLTGGQFQINSSKPSLNAADTDAKGICKN